MLEVKGALSLRLGCDTLTLRTSIWYQHIVWNVVGDDFVGLFIWTWLRAAVSVVLLAQNLPWMLWKFAFMCFPELLGVILYSVRDFQRQVVVGLIVFMFIFKPLSRFKWIIRSKSTDASMRRLETLCSSINRSLNVLISRWKIWITVLNGLKVYLNILVPRHWDLTMLLSLFKVIKVPLEIIHRLLVDVCEITGYFFLLLYGLHHLLAVQVATRISLNWVSDNYILRRNLAAEVKVGIFEVLVLDVNDLVDDQLLLFDLFLVPVDISYPKRRKFQIIVTIVDFMHF